MSSSGASRDTSIERDPAQEALTRRLDKLAGDTRSLAAYLKELSAAAVAGPEVVGPGPCKEER